jgi:hypothetical protein
MWCPKTLSCEHVESSKKVCVLRKDKSPSDTEVNIFKNDTEACPIEIAINEEVKQDNSAIVPIASGIAIAAAAALAVLIAIGVALRSKKGGGLIESEDFLKQGGANTIENPLYVEQTVSKQNMLYESKN